MKAEALNTLRRATIEGDNHVMALTPQERRCVELACRWLEQNKGSQWRIALGPSLDELHPNEPSPEVLVTDGTRTAAIEVKRLTGDGEFDAYIEATLSLRRSLAPSCGGHYFLNPPSDFRIPMDKTLLKRLRKEIERVAPTLALGQSGAIMLRRRGRLVLSSPKGRGQVICAHGSLVVFDGEVEGVFFLNDEDEHDHSFVTDDVRRAFRETLAAACRRCLTDGSSDVEWTEEWELARADEPASDGEEPDEEGRPSAAGRGSVEVVVGTASRDMFDANEEAVQRMVAQAREKFRHRSGRWADLHVAVLDSKGLMLRPRIIAAVLDSMSLAELEPLDLVLLKHHRSLARVWPSASSGDQTPVVDTASRGEDEDGEVFSTAGDEDEAWWEPEETPQEYERRMEDLIIDSPVDEDLRREFLDGYLAKRESAAVTDALFRRAGAYEHSSEWRDDMAYGVAILVMKGPFVRGANWLRQSPWKVAVAIERQLVGRLEALLRGATGLENRQVPPQDSGGQVAAQVGWEQVLAATDRLTERLATRGREPSLIAVAGDLPIDMLVELEKHLTLKWELPDELKKIWILGAHRGVPILHLNRSGARAVFVADLKAFASLTLYGDGPEFSLEGISEERARELLGSDPASTAWPNDVAAARIRQLRLRAELRLFESVDFTLLDADAAAGARVDDVTAA